MVVSRCCKANLFLLIDYYICENCGFCCDTINLSSDKTASLVEAATLDLFI